MNQPDLRRSLLTHGPARMWLVPGGAGTRVCHDQPRDLAPGILPPGKSRLAVSAKTHLGPVG